MKAGLSWIQNVYFLSITSLNMKMERLVNVLDTLAGLPQGHRKTITFTAVLRLSGMTAPMLLDGRMNADAFHSYVGQLLVQTLTPSDVVVMNNLSGHKVAGTREAIEAAGARRRNYGLTVSISIRSKWPFRSSKLICGPKPTAPLRRYGMA